MTPFRVPCLILLLAALPSAAFAQSIVARNGRALVEENSLINPVFVLTDDDVPDVDAAVLTIVSPPANGAAIVEDERILYSPDVDTGGEDRIGYRVCVDADCDEAIVYISVRPVVANLSRVSLNPAGTFALTVDGLRALPSARFDASALAAPELAEWSVGTDDTPRTPFDGSPGTFWDTRTSSDSTRWVVVRPDEDGIELAIGADTDGDGEPSEDEIACITTGPEDCTLPVTGPTAYWVLAHNTGDAAGELDFQWYEVAGEPDGSLFATGAGHVEADEEFRLRIGFVDDTLNPGRYRLGMVTVRSDADTVVGSFPVRVQFNPIGAERSPIPLADGRTVELSLTALEEHRTVFVDVPAGATLLRVTMEADRDVDLFLVPRGAQPLTPDTSIDESPDLALAFDSDTGPSLTKTVEVSGAQLQHGRWYVVPSNDTIEEARLELTAQIDAVAPVVRDGSYYNDLRSGHGLFLYPAGDQWTGLWYAYDRDGLPTWYYLQADLPGADGLWSSPIWRSTWDGDSNSLVAVGDLTVTPNGDDRFVLTYRIDGETGSEQLAEFGRGCPFNGTYDLSSTWFDPARAGTGYSIQFFPDYEYFAAYYYDDQGYSRFVAAELDHFGGTEPTLVVQQLRGACPTCTYVAPVRTDIGELRRRILSGDLQHVYTDIEYAPPLSGTWNVTDLVQLLGGPGTTQGCDP